MEASPLPTSSTENWAEQLQQLAAIGATRVVHAWRYPDAAAFARAADALRGAL